MQKHEVSLLLKQDAQVSKPNLIQPLRKGGMFRDGAAIAELWMNPHVYIHEVEDLPLVAKIVSRTRDKLRIRASEIVQGMTDAVIKMAKKYRHKLARYNVKFVEKRGGITFYANYVTLDHFSEEEGD